jgi:RNA 3'-terminal phosphate cyclase (ATP)
MVESTGGHSAVPVKIDGGMLEGGGQLFRMSIALSYLLRFPVVIDKIRANRPRGGGLSNQHLTGLQTIVRLVPGCKVTGAEKKSTKVSFNPGAGVISRKTYTADCTSPGAATLIL